MIEPYCKIANFSTTTKAREEWAVLKNLNFREKIAIDIELNLKAIEFLLHKFSSKFLDKFLAKYTGWNWPINKVSYPLTLKHNKQYIKHKIW